MSTKTPEQVAAAADDAYAHTDEEGGDLVEVTAERSPSTVISVRLNAEDLAELEAAATRGGQKLSSYLRASALATARQQGAVPAEVATYVLRIVESAALDVRQQLEKVTIADMAPGAARSGDTGGTRRDAGVPGRAPRKTSSAAARSVRSVLSGKASTKSSKSSKSSAGSALPGRSTKSASTKRRDAG